MNQSRSIPRVSPSKTLKTREKQAKSYEGNAGGIQIEILDDVWHCAPVVLDAVSQLMALRGTG
jgi:hypothetical protein